MTKVHEQIWVNTSKGIAVNTRYLKPEGLRTGPGGLDETCDGFVQFPTQEQQLLAAQAPSMARLLEKILQTGVLKSLPDNTQDELLEVLRAAGV